MIKLIHCADVHLGAQMNTHLPSAKAKQRRTEVRATFEKMVAWAKEQGVKRLELTVICENARAKHLYEKMGFEIEGTKKKSVLVDGAYLDEYYMAKIFS